MKYFKNTSWLLGEKILRLFVGVFLGVWIARYLGPEQFGLLSYAQSFVGIFAVISTMGLDSIVVRELVKNKNTQEGILGTVFCLKIIGALTSIILLMIAVYFTVNDYHTKILICIISSSVLFQAFNVVDFYFQSQVLSRYVVYANTVSLFISSLLKIVLILGSASLLSFVWVILFDSFILACGFLYFFIQKSKIDIINLRFQSEIAISLLKDSWPLLLSGIVISIYMKIDQVIIKQLLGAEEVGQYAAASRLSEAWYFIPMVIVSSLYPSIISAKQTNNETYCSRLQKLYDLMVGLSIAIAIPITFFGDIIIDLIYGSQYSESGAVLMLHIWTGVFVFIGVIFSAYLTIENQTKKAFYRTLIGAILNVTLNYVLIPIYGIKGAAIATLAAQLTSNYLYDIFDKELHGQFKMKTKAFFPVHLFKSPRFK